MASVDLALYFLLKRHGLESGARFCLLFTAEELYPNRDEGSHRRISRQLELPFPYEMLRGRLPEILDCKTIIFWGDFLHSRDYLQNVGKYLIRMGAAKTVSEATAIIHRHLYLSEQPDDVLSRCLVFGETLLFNRESDYHDSTYRAPFMRFMAGVRAVWMRDFYSTLRVATIRNTVEQVQPGVDCSLLLRPADVETLPLSDAYGQGADPGGTAGVFFGRSQGRQHRLGRFARDLCRRMGVSAEWIPWGDAGSFRDRSRGVRRGFSAMRIHDLAAPPLVGDLLTRVYKHRFVVTDTYHLCLNAWRAGVPAICIQAADLFLHLRCHGFLCLQRGTERTQDLPPALESPDENAA